MGIKLGFEIRIRENKLLEIKLIIITKDFIKTFYYSLISPKIFKYAYHCRKNSLKACIFKHF
jgi:hypothetical protein